MYLLTFIVAHRPQSCQGGVRKFILGSSSHGDTSLKNNDNKETLVHN